VVATGSVPVIPDVPGIDRPNVRIATKLLKEGQDTGQNVIIVGGGLVGCETGLHLAEKGKESNHNRYASGSGSGCYFHGEISLLEALRIKG